MNALNNAIVFATEKHAGQTDKVGQPYIFHPMQVMLSMNTLGEQILAILHDVIEDTDATYDDIRKLFKNNPEVDTDWIISGLKAITKNDKNESYREYLSRVKNHYGALNVKFADISHNTSPARLTMLDTKTQDKLRSKYSGALQFLQS